jgi:DNA-binding MarR family transcriptional regulator
MKLNTLDFLDEIMPYIKEFGRQSNSELTIEGFSQWLSKKIEPTLDEKIAKDDSSDANYGNTHINGNIIIGIGLMNRFAKLEIKQKLTGSTISSMEEFGYLAFLMQNNNISKSDLINHMVQEKTTGIEILKRLLSYNLIEEMPSKEDRRVKLVNITYLGRKEFAKVLPKLHLSTSIMVSSLNNQEKIELFNALSKLEKSQREFQNLKSKNTTPMLK